MDINRLMGLFEQAPVFESLAPSDYGILVGALRERSLRSGEKLCIEGRTGDSLFVLERGRLRVQFKGTDGSEVTVKELGPGEVVGEMSCVDPAPRSATVVALEDCEGYELSRLMLRSLQTHGPKVSVGIIGGVIKHVTERLRQTDARIESHLGGGRPAASPSAPGRQGDRPTPLRRRVDLGAVPSLGALDKRDLDVLMGAAPPVLYKRGSVLCGEGEPGASCFLILEGEVDVLREVNGGVSRLATLKPGAFVGQMALVDSSPRSATIRAATDEVVAMELQRDVFQGLLAAASPLAIHFQEQIAVAGIRQLRMADKHLTRILGSGRPAQKPRLATSTGRAGAVSAASLSRRPKITSSNRVPSRPSSPSRPSVPRRTAPSSASKQVAKKKRAKPTAQKPATDVLAYLQTALTEWGMSVEELDNVSVSTPAGQMSSAEMKARRRR